MALKMIRTNILALVVLAASVWQCANCGRLFESEQPSQSCGGC